MERTISTPVRTVAATLVAAVCLLSAPRPAAADGAASTRNIIFGAAAIGGTLLILNHNKKVHEKYAEYDRRQAQTQAEANQSQAAYESERQAYSHEASLVSEYKKETEYQHAQIKQRDAQIASLQHSLQVAKTAGAVGTSAAFVRQTAVAPPAVRTASTSANAQPVQVVSYGWGQY